MKDISKTLKENTSAIITALVVFFMVLYYLMAIVPHHRDQLDAYNRVRLRELEKQFMLTLNDYANQIDTSAFSKKLFNDSKIVKTLSDSKFTDASKIDLGKNIDLDNVLKNKLDKIQIEKISIDSISGSSNYFTLSTLINFKIDTSTTIYVLRNSILIKKSELIKRIKGAVTFPYWLVYFNKDYSKQKDNEDGVFLNNGIEWQEFDSLKFSGSPQEFITYKFSDKRFYKCLMNIPGTNTNFVLVAAENNMGFEERSRKADVIITLLGVVIVLLMFFCIPLIKPIVSSAREKLTQFDLINTSVCTGLSVVILSVYIVSVYLNKLHYRELDAKLKNFNDTTSQIITKELYGNIAIFNRLYSRLNDYPFKKHTSVKTLESEKTSYELPALAKAMKNKMPDIIFDLDSSGRMAREVLYDERFSLFKNYRDREYFEKVNASSYKAYLSAVFSKTNNLYEFVYAQANDKAKGVKAFAYSPRALNGLKIDQAYGYLLCNKEGKVILHSDPTKSLNENLYNITQRPHKLLEVLRGRDTTNFELEYNGVPCRFYAKKFNYTYSAQIPSAPLYLLTFKNLTYENQLQVHLVLNGALISLAYAIGISLILLIYSVFFYYGHLSVFSKYHVYWLFPDKSRKPEFRFLTYLNYSVTIGLIAFVFISNKHTLYLTLLIGLNLAFINFVLLTQRAFIFVQASAARKRYLALLITVIFLAALISYLFYHFKFPSFSLITSMLLHFAFLYYLKRQTVSPYTQTFDVSVRKNKQTSYSIYITSMMKFHYLLIPAIVVTILFRSEIHNVRNYNLSYIQQHKITESGDWNSKEDLITDIVDVTPPSSIVLAGTSFDNLQTDFNSASLLQRIFSQGNRSLLVYFIFYLIVLIIIIRMIISYYSARFFFFELSELYRLNFSDKDHRFVNRNKVLPPFCLDDLKQLETHEMFNGRLKAVFSPTDITASVASKHRVIELIISESIHANYTDYKNIWNALSEDEKFVLFDFASDYFVNYKNRFTLISLIKRGLIIADPITGRLRIMNYSFRQFVIEYENIDPNFSAVELEQKIKGTFAKWKLPLIIIACSFLLVLVYMFRESYDKILFFGGSIFSTVALMAKFLNTYKK